MKLGSIDSHYQNLDASNIGEEIINSLDDRALTKYKMEYLKAPLIVNVVLRTLPCFIRSINQSRYIEVIVHPPFHIIEQYYRIEHVD